MSWAARNLAAYIATGATTTEITPNTGALSTAGQAAHVRPIHGNAGSLTITGQQPRFNVGIKPGTGSLTLTGKPVVVGASSKVISKEYVGDGASTRSFNSVGFVPMAVIVFGKDGSGNLVGSIKTPNMAAGISQPLKGNASAADAGRSNRILTLDANGFTVGPDLNVTGRNYAYIMFPVGRASVVNTGMYIGHGGDQTRNSTLRTNHVDVTAITGDTQIIAADGSDCAIAWHHPFGGNAYDPSQALTLGGRRIIRNSDGAVIAEMTSFVNTQEAHGVVYIAGVFGGTTWHLEEDYIDLAGNDADLVFVMNGDSTGVNAVPFTVTKSAWMAATNQGWDGTGTGELVAHLGVAGDTRMHIYPSYSTPGVEYTWFSVKGGVTALGLGIGVFNYVGDSSINPQVLSGLPFVPEWIWGTNGGADFRWAKRSAAIIGNSRTRTWNDGAGDNTNYDNTFTSDGINIAGGPGEFWNSTGGLYTFILFVADAAIELTTITPAAGALSLVGQAVTVRRDAARLTPAVGTLQFTGQLARILQKIQITVGTALADGGGSSGGVYDPGVYDPGVYDTGSTLASLNLVGQQARVEIAIGPIKPGTGSLSLVGKTPVISTPAITRFITPKTGSMIITPRNPIRAVKRTITPKVAALTFQGRASKTKETKSPGPPPKKFHETPDTGELQFSGKQPILKRGIKPGTGALTATGQKPFVRPPDFVAFTHSGALTLTGQQPKQRITITPNTGALALNGQAGIVNSTIPPIRTNNTGVLGLVGQQPVLKTSLIPVTGELQLQTFNTEPIVETNVTKITPLRGTLNFLAEQPIVVESGTTVTITPNTGALNFVGQQPIVQTGAGATITPNTGSLILTGQPAIVLQSGGSATITPGCGALNLVGQRCRIRTPQPPIPPTPGPTGGGIGLPTPRKLPFWPKTIVRATGRIIGPPAVLQGWARVEENEMALFDD